MRKFERVIWIVLDSVGIGALPDAGEYGDTGRNTLGHIAESRALQIPNLTKLGLGDIAPLAHVPPASSPRASFGKGATHSPGKDTTTGHWEMAGVWLDQAFPVYKQGFPPEIMDAFEAQIGRKTIGNKPASGTEIIKELGEEHVRTGKPIVYTSGDSVFQIAAHEEVIPIPELYRMCEIARKLLDGKHRVGRVIARPFIGTAGHFTRTARRHDYAVDPQGRCCWIFCRSAACPCLAWAKSTTFTMAAAWMITSPRNRTQMEWRNSRPLRGNARRA
jgi:phosphopentomutase